MRSLPVTSTADPLLAPFLDAPDTESDQTLTRLLDDHAEPVIRRVIAARLHPGRGDVEQDVEDIHNDALLQVLSMLRDVKAAHQARAIIDFRRYVAVVAQHACQRYFREKRPRRSQLKDRLRYLLASRAEFTMWTTEHGRRLCGLTRWGARTPAPGARPLDGRPLRTAPTADLAALVRRILAILGGPIELDDLTNTVAAVKGVEHAPTTLSRSDIVRSAMKEAAARGSVAAEVEQRLFLRRLWAEICELPPRQRAALLLNLRDAHGCSSIELFLLLGIAGIRSMARTVGLPAEEFAALWKELPLDDARIAKRLGVTRQQVINLRKSARDRLARRMKRAKVERHVSIRPLSESASR